ncbi:glycosyltransferase [Arthrobacter sp. zg-Y820]|uniref:glycosyltransferase n=1 Tax=unclassified Arthrobacter TaxID=235627 RepID=UPI001E415E46|nr:MULTISPECIES: glycosyltransferase [unclassified Arthrobacter]MCC9196005.1 glycosyltransferase [Arthrobacter sp. zg-Y820]MDK1278864.1 glycosyltransferase [Arthrobacter sp. zg.Y820]WIB08721.1 glycosyltransferase [Arthrobacter sp. zg-Y820]
MSVPIGVTAVISAFNPPADLVAKVERLLKQVDHVVVVDDGSPKDVSEVLAGLESAGALVLRQESNMGIAAALNAGIAAARRFSPEWYLTLDQDSELDPDYVERALQAAEAAKRAAVPVGMVCAESHNRLPVMLQKPGEDFPEAFDPMQSGTLIPASTLEAVGMLEDDLFIDCVDSEYTARIRQHGLKAIIAPGCNITHAVGDARPMRLGTWHVTVGGQKRFVHSHAPFRVYYITRNGIVMYRRYATKQPVWVLRRIGLEVVFYGVRVVYGPHRLRQIAAIGLGIRDALTGRMGKISPAGSKLVTPRR